MVLKLNKSKKKSKIAIPCNVTLVFVFIMTHHSVTWGLLTTNGLYMQAKSHHLLVMIDDISTVICRATFKILSTRQSIWYVVLNTISKKRWLYACMYNRLYIEDYMYSVVIDWWVLIWTKPVSVYRSLWSDDRLV